jgi:serine/threonine-protein kinase
MRPVASQRVIGSVAILVAIASSGCARPIDGTAVYNGGADGASAPLVKLAQLQDLVPAPADVGALIGAPSLRGIAAYVKPDALPTGSISEGDCISVMTPGEESVYRGSGYRSVFGRVDDDPSARRTSVGVAAFDGAEEAHRFVTAQVESWRGCAGKPLTVKLIGPPVTWTADTPVRSNGVDVVSREQEQGQGYACGRGIASWSNVVADVLVCSPDGTSVAAQAAAVANLTLSRIPR